MAIFLQRDVVGLIHVFSLSNLMTLTGHFIHVQVGQSKLYWSGGSIYTNAMWLEPLLQFNILTLVISMFSKVFDDINASLEHLFVGWILVTDQNHIISRGTDALLLIM